jgi:hypothetical protein
VFLSCFGSTEYEKFELPFSLDGKREWTLAMINPELSVESVLEDLPAKFGGQLRKTVNSVIVASGEG